MKRVQTDVQGSVAFREDEPATAIFGAYGVPPLGGQSHDQDTTRILAVTTGPPDGGFTLTI